MKRGKLIVFYGINNLGKSTQAKLLAEKLCSKGHQAVYLKYPFYNLEPSGSLINSYLREGNPYKLTAREAQILFAYNRIHYQANLKQTLEAGNNVVAEDYWGTGVAWGVGVGVDKRFLLQINEPFAWEDLAFLFVGKRFDSGIERSHLHEQDAALTEKVRLAHDELAKQFDWKKIEANQSVEKVHKDVWTNVTQLIK